MAEREVRLGDLVTRVRSKNAGPFWQTIDVFCGSDDKFALVRNSGVLDPERIGAIYGVDPSTVEVYEIPALHVVKVSFPRKVVAGSFHDCDLHAGQQHIPLARAVVGE